jgi:hypothetical protein
MARWLPRQLVRFVSPCVKIKRRIRKKEEEGVDIPGAASGR